VDSAYGSELQALKAPPSTTPPPVQRAVTLLTVVHGWKPDAERWLLSVFTHCKADFEAMIIDNSGDERIAAWLESRAAERLRSVRLAPPLGFAAAVNAGIEAAAGDVVILFGLGRGSDGGRSDAAGRGARRSIGRGRRALRTPRPGNAEGVRGQPGPGGDAIEGYCMAFRRSDAQARMALIRAFGSTGSRTLEFSFRLRDRGAARLSC